MPQSKKVVKFKKRKNINIGVIIFIIIAVYMIINTYLFLTKSQISIYEVREESLAKDSVVTGIAIREEQLVTTSKAGYVNYYQREGARISKNTTVYSIDESKVIYEKLADSGEGISLTKSDIQEIKRDITLFKKSYTDDKYSNVYSFKDDITSSIQELIDVNLLNNMETLVNNTGFSSSFEVNKADSSGIITYKVDSLDGITADQVTLEDYNTEEYTKTNLRTLEITEAGATVYKLVTSENWSIVAPISNEIYQEIKDKSSITFTIMSDNLTITAPIHITQVGSDYFLHLDLDKYMVRYLGERYIELDLKLSTESGYKIPLSAITEKQFFMVPTSYLTLGGDSEEQGIVVQTYDTNGKVSYNFTPVTVYFEDETYSYIDLDIVDHGSLIYDTVTNETFPVSMVGKLEGVLNINKGYAVFRRIERITENEEYCIVKKNTSNGLSLYDHIALDANDAVESQLIY